MLSPSQWATLAPVPMNVLLVTTSGRLVGLLATIALRLAMLIMRPNLGDVSHHGNLSVAELTSYECHTQHTHYCV